MKHYTYTWSNILVVYPWTLQKPLDAPVFSYTCTEHSIFSVTWDKQVLGKPVSEKASFDNDICLQKF